MEWYEKSIATKEDTDGIELIYGDEVVVGRDQREVGARFGVVLHAIRPEFWGRP